MRYTHLIQIKEGVLIDPSKISYVELLPFQEGGLDVYSVIIDGVEYNLLEMHPVVIYILLNMMPNTLTD